jgi:hypothetical protein
MLTDPLRTEAVVQMAASSAMLLHRPSHRPYQRPTRGLLRVEPCRTNGRTLSRLQLRKPRIHLAVEKLLGHNNNTLTLNELGKESLATNLRNDPASGR